MASNGDVYMAVSHYESDPYAEFFHVYRSTDDGESFVQIGTIASSYPDYDRLYSIDVVEGVDDRVFVTYMHRNASRGAFDVRVAYAPLGSDSVTWTERTVMDNAGVSFLGPDMTTDALSFSDYYLYMVCAGLDGNGDDIFYSRSTDRGNTWSTPYRIHELTSSGNLMLSSPKIAYGFGGALHVIYSYTERLQDTFDDGLIYKKATNYGASAADWPSGAVGLEPVNDGADLYPKDIVVSHDGSWVSTLVTGVNALSPRVRNSNTAGVDWTLPRVSSLPLTYASSLHWDDVGGRLLLGGAESHEGSTGRRAAHAHAPTSDPQTFGDVTILGDVSPSYGWADVKVHPTRSPSTMLSYTASLSGGEYRAAFDGAWRGGPGFPNYEPGFPVDVPLALGDVRTSPALFDLDGDGTLEIIFSDTGGNVRAYHSDGTVVAGWPVSVGSIDGDSPVAVGELGGEPTVVVGDGLGFVHAFAADGSVRDGFPVDMGTSQDTYVSIGAVGPPYPQWIVAVSGGEEARINWRGEAEFKSGSLVGKHKSPAAIGDVDGDGQAEIVYAFANGDDRRRRSPRPQR